MTEQETGAPLSRLAQARAQVSELEGGLYAGRQREFRPLPLSAGAPARHNYCTITLSLRSTAQAPAPANNLHLRDSLFASYMVSLARSLSVCLNLALSLS